MRRSPRTLRASALALTVPVLALALLAVVAPAHNPVLAAAPSLHVSGNHIVDAGGNTVVFHGVNRSGGEFACVQGNGIWDGPMDQASIDAMKTWGVNTVRIPLNEACWNAESYVNAVYAGATYQAAVQSYVNLLNSNGMIAILDLHWTDGLYTGTSSGCANATATCQKPMPDAAQAIPFWTSVATMFKGNGAVVFDLFNEPYPERATGNETTGWQCWRDGGTCSGISYTVAGMQTLVNAIRGTGATNIIELGGLAYSNDETAWLTYKPTDTANNLVASWHTYNFNSCSNTSCFDSQLAPVIASVPLVAGEIGENDCGSSYITTVMNWLDAHGTGYLGWTWNTWDCSTGPSLISNFDGTATAYGAGFKTHLLAISGQTPTPPASGTPLSTRQSPTPSPSPVRTATPITSGTPTQTGGSGTCSASVHVDNSWGTGFQATVTVSNTGTSPTTSWRVTWSWPGSQTISNYWNAAVTQSGAAVAANNLSYNGAIGAGGSSTFGLQVNGASATPSLSCAANGGSTVTPSPTAASTPTPTPIRTATPPPPTPTPTPIRTATPPPPTPTPTAIRTATPPPPTPTPGTARSCSAGLHVDNSWGGGFQATVTVSNTGTVATKTWRVTWTWGGNQSITNGWNATVTQSGTAVTATNLSYNGAIAASGNTAFGFQASFSGTNTVPALTCSAT